MGAKAAGGEAEKVFLYTGRQRWAPAEAGQGAEWGFEHSGAFPFSAKTPAGKRNRKRSPGFFVSERLGGEKRRKKAVPKGTAFRLTIFSVYNIMTASNKGKPLEGG